MINKFMQVSESERKSLFEYDCRHVRWRESLDRRTSLTGRNFEASAGVEFT